MPRKNPPARSTPPRPSAAPSTSRGSTTSGSSNKDEDEEDEETEDTDDRASTDGTDGDDEAGDEGGEAAAPRSRSDAVEGARPKDGGRPNSSARGRSPQNPMPHGGKGSKPAPPRSVGRKSARGR